jgi:hypothetical protein
LSYLLFLAHSGVGLFLGSASTKTNEDISDEIPLLLQGKVDVTFSNGHVEKLFGYILAPQTHEVRDLEGRH